MLLLPHHEKHKWVSTDLEYNGVEKSMWVIFGLITLRLTENRRFYCMESSSNVDASCRAEEEEDADMVSMGGKLEG